MIHPLDHPFVRALRNGCPGRHCKQAEKYAAWRTTLQIMCDEVGVELISADHPRRGELVASRQTVIKLLEEGIDPERIMASYLLCFGEMPDAGIDDA